MQNPGERFQTPNDEVNATFAERAKSARLRAGMTQQQLATRLRHEKQVKLDTSAITRIEAGQRDPRLPEALAIARILKFSLDDLGPQADLDFYMEDVERLMDESRAALVKMIRALDPVSDFVKRNPDCLGDGSLEDRLRERIDRFRQDISQENVAVTRNRTDEKLKRQLLRAVNDGILVNVDDLPLAHERWFTDDKFCFGEPQDPQNPQASLTREPQDPEDPEASPTSEPPQGWRTVKVTNPPMEA